MSELILPEHVARKVKAKSAVPEVKAEVSPVESAYVKQEELYLDPTKMDMTAIERLPKPTGWRMLVLPFRGQGKTQGNVYLPDEYVERQTLATVVGYVLHMGADCYTDNMVQKNLDFGYSCFPRKLKFTLRLLEVQNLQ